MPHTSTARRTFGGMTSRAPKPRLNRRPDRLRGARGTEPLNQQGSMHFYGLFANFQLPGDLLVEEARVPLLAVPRAGVAAALRRALLRRNDDPRRFSRGWIRASTWLPRNQATFASAP